MSDYLDALSNLEPGETISAQGNPGGETTFTVNRNDDDDDDNDSRSRDSNASDASAVGLSDFDQGLLNEAARRDEEIIQDAVREQQEVDRADRDLREAADERDREIRTGGGFDATLEREAERLNRESEELMQQERETSDRDLFEAAREQGRRDFIEQELDREDRRRMVTMQAEAERELLAERQARGTTPTGLRRGPQFTGQERSLAEAATLTSGFIRDIATAPRAVSPTAIAFGADPIREPTAVEVGFTTGALELANVFATAEGFRAGAEFTEERIIEAEEQGVGSSIDTTEQAVDETVDAFEEQFERAPVETTAMIVGSLAASGGIFAGARAAGVGGIARGIIQPGEEIAGIGGFRATRLLAGERAAQRLFPNEEVLLFSEEAAIRGAQRAGARVRDVIDRTDVSFPGVAAGLPRVEIEIEPAEQSVTEPEVFVGGGALADATRQAEAAAFNLEFEQTREPFARGELTAEQGLPSERVFRPTLEDRLPDLFGTEVELETELQQEQQLFQRRFEIDAEGLLDVEAEQEQLFDLEQEFELEAELEQELEIEQELEQELELETEIETEFEQELELELETELRQEQELDQEVEIFLPEVAERSAEDQAGIGFAGVRTIEAELRPTEFEAE